VKLRVRVRFKVRVRFWFRVRVRVRMRVRVRVRVRVEVRAGVGRLCLSGQPRRKGLGWHGRGAARAVVLLASALVNALAEVSISVARFRRGGTLRLLGLRGGGGVLGHQLVWGLLPRLLLGGGCIGWLLLLGVRTIVRNGSPSIARSSRFRAPQLLPVCSSCVACRPC
jgi:hypothetical protein